MKKTLKEELERIHQLSYGGVIQKKLSLLEDDEKKADLVKDNVSEFFRTLEDIEEPVSEQNKGERTFQKNVETIQIGLELLGYELPLYGIDGKFGSETADAVKKFKSDNKLNQNKGLTVLTKDDIEKMIELLKKKNIKSEDIQNYINQTLETSDRNYTKISKKGQELLNNEEFKNKLNDVCKFLGIEPQWLTKVMYKESGLNPSAINSIGCGGLVGFCPDSPRGDTKTLNKRQYSISELRSSPLLQLDAIKDMLINYRGKIHSYEDLYLFNFWPAAMGKSDNYVIGNSQLSPELISRQNSGIAKKAGKQPGEPLTVADFKIYANA
jgi:hypothetical protein